ncbi:Uncharacterised protein [Mycolicibacterium smegmatis]|nr:Uncharacterised protein [Mycolicibacterium smegmatis]
MTHITEPRVIGNHADMGPSRAKSDDVETDSRLTPSGVCGAGARKTRGSLRSMRRRQKVEALTRWESEGGAPAVRPADDMSETS